MRAVILRCSPPRLRSMSATGPVVQTTLIGYWPLNSRCEPSEGFFSSLWADALQPLSVAARIRNALVNSDILRNMFVGLQLGKANRSAWALLTHQSGTAAVLVFD